MPVTIENQKSLAVSLSSVITGDQTDTNIPWADDEQQEQNGDSRSKDRISDQSTASIETLSDSDPSRRKSLMERRNVTLFLNISSKDGEDEDSERKKTKNNESDENDKNSDDGSADDDPAPLLGTNGPGARSYRRNSISLPALNAIDLEALREAHEAAKENRTRVTPDDVESMVCSITDHESTDHSEEEEEKPKRLFRTKRRASIAPLPALRLNDKEMMANEFDSQSVITQNSITSVGSLASLLKEKMQMFPAMLKKKRKTTKDYKIKAFVAILFLIIVFLIGYAYIMYNQQVLARSYFDRVKFNKANRVIRVFDEKGLEIVTGRLGTTVLADKPYHCLNDNNLKDGSICLEWDGRARLYLNFSALAPSVPCYTIRWQALTDDIYPTDCYEVTEDTGHWFGGGLTKQAEWPFEKNSFPFAPFITGDANKQQWGNALKRYFISSRGVAIQVDDKTPLYVSMNSNNSGEFCLRAKNDDFAFVNRLTSLPELSYKICTNDNMKTLHQQMTQQSLWDGLKQQDINIVHSLIEEPVWQIPASSPEKMNETTIYNYTENVIALGFLRLGHVLVNEFWQKNIGDFTLDEERFVKLDETVTILHRRGFRIVFSIQPFISTDSANFGDAVAKKLLIYERLSERSIPALTRYKSTASAGVLDVTNNASIPWLLEKLDKIVKAYEIDAFFIDFGTSHNMPHYYQCSRTLDNPDQYKTIFTSNLDGAIGLIGVSSAVAVPRPPAFVSLPPVNSSWDGLRKVVITSLSYGIIGYPFIMPGPIGGDYYSSSSSSQKTLSFYSLEEPPLPEQELYIRWLQLATFLPVLRFTHLPSEYKDDFVTEVAKELTAIRQKTVIKILKNYLSDAMNEGLPLIRPLWMLDSQDPACLFVNDEFSVGEELIVAPILEKGQTRREVYLPHGVWKDGIDGSLRKGSRWIHNYPVPVDKVAYFVKMPDNTRF